MFLFVLFFEPFNVNTFSNNNKPVFIVGLGAIVFLSIFCIRVVFFDFFERISNSIPGLAKNINFNGLVIFVLSCIALTFYLKYVGNLSINFLIMFKIIFICIPPPVILKINDSLSRSKTNIDNLLKDINLLQKKIEEYEKFYRNKSIAIISENGTERIELLISDILLVRSADNYVEIIYKTKEGTKKKLIRNTLKNIEYQTSQFSNFGRCHRTCIVNFLDVHSLERKQNNYWLRLTSYPDLVPVSRQYLSLIKEIIQENRDE